MNVSVANWFAGMNWAVIGSVLAFGLHGPGNVAKGEMVFLILMAHSWVVKITVC